MKSLIGIIFVLCIVCSILAESDLLQENTNLPVAKVMPGENMQDFPELIDKNGKFHGKFFFYRTNEMFFQVVIYDHGYVIRREHYGLDGELMTIYEEDHEYNLVQVYPPAKAFKSL